MADFKDMLGTPGMRRMIRKSLENEIEKSSEWADRILNTVRVWDGGTISGRVRHWVVPKNGDGISVIACSGARHPDLLRQSFPAEPKSITCEDCQVAYAKVFLERDL